MSCNCIFTIDAMLAERNTRLVHSISLGVDGRLGFTRPILQTEKVETRQRGLVARMVPTFCPFCGERYEPAPAAQQEAD